MAMYAESITNVVFFKYSNTKFNEPNGDNGIEKKKGQCVESTCF